MKRKVKLKAHDGNIKNEGRKPNNEILNLPT